MHLSLLDFDHFGKTGNQMEEHFGTGTTWITFHFQRPIQLNFRSLSRTLLNHTFVSCVHHGLNTLHLVQYFNSFRSSPELSMLMHIPMTRDQRRAVENWNFPGDTPWYIVIEAARSRL